MSPNSDEKQSEECLQALGTRARTKNKEDLVNFGIIFFPQITLVENTPAEPTT